MLRVSRFLRRTPTPWFLATGEKECRHGDQEERRGGEMSHMIQEDRYGELAMELKKDIGNQFIPLPQMMDASKINLPAAGTLSWGASSHMIPSYSRFSMAGQFVSTDAAFELKITDPHLSNMIGKMKTLDTAYSAALNILAVKSEVTCNLENTEIVTKLLQVSVILFTVYLCSRLVILIELLMVEGQFGLCSLLF